MSQQQRIHEQTGEVQSERRTASSSPSTVSNAQMLEYQQAIQTINEWLDTQREVIESMGVMQQPVAATQVLQLVESRWDEYLNSGYLLEFPAQPSSNVRAASQRVQLPTQLASNLRYFIEHTELINADAPSEASADGVDWNSRLGIPEYRTQSDNLVAPEATCNVTTLAMVLERLGYNRQDLINALEARMGLNPLSSPEARDESWLDSTMDYLNDAMRDASYKRVRGQTSVSRANRTEIAEDFFANAQLEDLIDMLANDMNFSRYGAISEPDRLLAEITGDGREIRTTKIHRFVWEDVSEQVNNCIINGGAAALSFRHKGRRSSATHIVSILSVESDGFRIDDPYGDIRDDYAPNRSDDAYWSRDENDRIIASRERSSQQNVPGEFEDWGINWARSLREEENRGRESFISSEQMRRGFNYIQLFQNGALAPMSSALPQARPANLESGQAPQAASQRPVARPPNLRIQ